MTQLKCWIYFLNYKFSCNSNIAPHCLHKSSALKYKKDTGSCWWLGHPRYALCFQAWIHNMSVLSLPLSLLSLSCFMYRWKNKALNSLQTHQEVNIMHQRDKWFRHIRELFDRINKIYIDHISHFYYICWK